MNKIVIIAILVLLLFVAGFVFMLKQKTQVPEWNGLQPDKSDIDEVEKKLGQPIAKETTTLGTTYFYESGNPIFPNTIVFDEEGKVELIAVQVSEELKLSDIEKKYGHWEKEAYNTYLPRTKTYVFPKRGIAVASDVITEEVYGIQYFEPMALEEYLIKWGDFLYEENPFSEDYIDST